MIMTAEEIVRDFRAAASPRKQIGILAELNDCEKKDIAAILMEAGEQVPLYYRVKPEAAADEGGKSEILRCAQEVRGVDEVYHPSVMSFAHDSSPLWGAELGARLDERPSSTADAVPLPPVGEGLGGEALRQAGGSEIIVRLIALAEGYDPDAERVKVDLLDALELLRQVAIQEGQEQMSGKIARSLAKGDKA